jgi:DNA-binding response OmpR family regulator
MQLLLVEDNRSAAFGVASGLREAGHRVTIINSARPAIGAIADQQPDAVIIDVSLPDLDGITLAGFVRKAWPSLPIVFTTGHDDDYPGLRAAEAQPHTSLLHKPYAIDQLISELEKMVG